MEETSQKLVETLPETLETTQEVSENFPESSGNFQKDSDSFLENFVISRKFWKFPIISKTFLGNAKNSQEILEISQQVQETS